MLCLSDDVFVGWASFLLIIALIPSIGIGRDTPHLQWLQNNSRITRRRLIFMCGLHNDAEIYAREDSKEE